MEIDLVYVIHEEDLQDGEKVVVGVANSLVKVQPMIDEYYGEHKVIYTQDIRDSNLEYSQVLELEDAVGIPYQVRITIETFNLNWV